MGFVAVTEAVFEMGSAEGGGFTPQPETVRFGGGGFFVGAKIFGECSALRIYTITYQHQVIGKEIHFIKRLVSCYIGIYK